MSTAADFALWPYLRFMGRFEATQTCRYCGRAMEARRRWEGREVRYCSARCRSATRPRLDRALEAAIMELLAARQKGATICPSEAARMVEPERWRALMERTRCAARRLVAAHRIEILQKGAVVDPSRARGPIRLRRLRRCHIDG